MIGRFLRMSFVRPLMPSFAALASTVERKQKPILVGSANQTEGASSVKSRIIWISWCCVDFWQSPVGEGFKL